MDEQQTLARFDLESSSLFDLGRVPVVQQDPPLTQSGRVEQAHRPTVRCSSAERELLRTPFQPEFTTPRRPRYPR